MGLLVSTPAVLLFSFLLSYIYMKPIGFGNPNINLKHEIGNFFNFMWRTMFSQGKATHFVIQIANLLIGK